MVIFLSANGKCIWLHCSVVSLVFHIQVCIAVTRQTSKQKDHISEKQCFPEIFSNFIEFFFIISWDTFKKKKKIQDKHLIIEIFLIRSEHYI